MPLAAHAVQRKPTDVREKAHRGDSHLPRIVVENSSTTAYYVKSADEMAGKQGKQIGLHTARAYMAGRQLPHPVHAAETLNSKLKEMVKIIPVLVMEVLYLTTESVPVITWFG